ncbi:MAG: HAD family hydrolase [Treponema sp.]
MSKISGIDAIAFDIDGTLYPSWKFTLRCIPFFFKNIRFMNAFRQVRSLLHKHSTLQPDRALPDFFTVQNELLADHLSISAEEAGAFLKEHIYEGWRKEFERIKPFPFAKEAVMQLKAAGFKIGMLSDFPPEQKGTVWDILPLCDAVIGSESTGALKPSRIPFMRLSEVLETPCERILYVGNSRAYDVAGAAAAGMKTACIESALSYFLRRKHARPDISFSNYRKFLKYVL